MKKENHEMLTFIGIVTIIYGLMYAILGALSSYGIIEGALPAHENHYKLALTVSYLITIISFVNGILSIKGSFKKNIRVSIILSIMGLISLIYNLLTQNIFNNFDCIAIVLSLASIYLTLSAENRQKEFKKSFKRKKKKETKDNIEKKIKKETINNTKKKVEKETKNNKKKKIEKETTNKKKKSK